MKPIVPFIHSLSVENEIAWRHALQLAVPEVDIRLWSDLSEVDKSSAEVAIVANPDMAELEDCPNLKWVQSLWAGVEGLIKEFQNRNITIVRLVDPQLADTMAEAALAWTLYLHRDMPLYAGQQTKMLWKQHPLPLASDRVVGVLGLGHLGSISAKRLHENGFGVLGWSRTKKELDDIETLTGEDGLIEIARRVDILLVLLPLTPQTKGLVSPQLIGHLKPGSSLINFARADIVDSQALTKALETRHIAHAVLDVFLTEPLPQSDPLWANQHVTVLPHISAPTNKVAASKVVADNMRNYFDKNIIPEGVSRHQGY